MANTSSSSGFRLVSLKIPSLIDESVKRQVQQTHKRTGYTELLRQPHLVTIQKILKPATILVDSILLDKKEPEKRIGLELSGPLELNSALSELEWARYFYFFLEWMEEITDKTGKMLEEINIHLLSMDVLHKIGSGLTWDAKAIKIIGSFVFKYVEFFVFLLRGPDTPLSEFESSVVALKENPVSLAGSQLEKFQNQIDQLNSVIKITLEMIEDICDLTLLSDTEHMVASSIQINVPMENGDEALDFSHLVSNLSYILNDLKHQKTIHKSQLEEMEAHMMANELFKESFRNVKRLYDIPTGISDVMTMFLHSNDSKQSVFDGLWYIKGRWFTGSRPAGVLVDPSKDYPYANSGAIDKLMISKRKKGFPSKSLEIRYDGPHYAAPTAHADLHKGYKTGAHTKKNSPHQKKPASGFQGLSHKKIKGDKGLKLVYLNVS
ncbi:hypothetical protein L6164_013106 [Bauhinia variegata]|uniref:Uncharacterized protein n=1 Tax=Bauhinia variegata TaxID=167791 RepID=A0ACB9PC88_BAUVA|nr:hypothetical protein L6164_013106 [Bauhinia variegata]